MTKLNLITLKRYYTLLKMVFLVIEVPAWFINRDKRLAKSPKVYMNDTRLACYFKHLDQQDFLHNQAQLGALLENFVVMELKKQATWNSIITTLYHFRTLSGQAVDIVLEGRNKAIVGIEVKASTKIDAHDLKGLKYLKEIAGSKFKKGIILYTGEQAVYLGENLYALPINTLWEV